MAHTKAKGTSKLGRDSHAKRLGVKVSNGQKISAGAIIIRQRGTKFFPGENVKRGKDDILYAIKEGQVVYSHKGARSFSGKLRDKKIVSVN